MGEVSAADAACGPPLYYHLHLVLHSCMMAFGGARYKIFFSSLHALPQSLSFSHRKAKAILIPIPFPIAARLFPYPERDLNA